MSSAAKNNLKFVICNLKSPRGFTLVELMIIVGILGILAAIVMPEFQGHTQQAKEAAAKDNLRILRTAIERYAVDNGIAPGYPSNDSTNPAMAVYVYRQLVNPGKYLSELPVNPLNDSDDIIIVQNNEDFPIEAVESRGWIYKPSTKEVRCNHLGTDSEGKRYYDY